MAFHNANPMTRKAGPSKKSKDSKEAGKGKVVNEPPPKTDKKPSAKETDEINVGHRRRKDELLAMIQSNIEAAEAFGHPAVKRQLDRANRAIEEVFRCFFVRDRECRSSALEGVVMKAANFEAFRTHCRDASDTIRTLTVPNSPKLINSRMAEIRKLEKENGLIILEPDTLRKDAEINKATRSYKAPSRDAYGMLGRFLFGIIED